jgi:hypothetical protein
MNNGECIFVWIEDGDISGDFWRNAGIEHRIIGRVKEQIVFLSKKKETHKSIKNNRISKTSKWKKWQKPFENMETNFDNYCKKMFV